MKFPRIGIGQVVFLVIAILVALFLPLPVLAVVLILLGLFGKHFGLGMVFRIVLVTLGIVILMLAAFIVLLIASIFGMM